MADHIRTCDEIAAPPDWSGYPPCVGDPECPICESGVPLDSVGELEGVWVTIPRWTPVPGYVCLVAKRHVREPFELPEPEREAFWRDVDRVAALLSAGLRPDKLNYEKFTGTPLRTFTFTCSLDGAPIAFREDRLTPVRQSPGLRKIAAQS